MKEPLHTISLVEADESQAGESPYIHEVLRGGGVVPHILRSDVASAYSQGVRNAIIDSDEPFEIARYVFNWFIFNLARGSGARVLLDGVDADMIIPHEYYFAALIRSFDWKTLAAELSYESQTAKRTRWRILKSYGLLPMMPRLYLSLMALLGRRQSLPLGTLLSNDFRSRANIEERWRTRQHRLFKAAKDIGTLHCHSYVCGILPFFMEATGRMAATLGVENRHPFLDRRMIEFFLSLPLRMKTQTPLPKTVMRVGMEGILPDKVRLRNHHNHPGLAFVRSLLERQPEIVGSARLNRSLEFVRRYVNETILVDVLNKRSFGSNNEWQSWQVLTLVLWLNARNVV